MGSLLEWGRPPCRVPEGPDTDRPQRLGQLVRPAPRAQTPARSGPNTDGPTETEGATFGHEGFSPHEAWEPRRCPRLCASCPHARLASSPQGAAGGLSPLLLRYPHKLPPCTPGWVWEVRGLTSSHPHHTGSASQSEIKFNLCLGPTYLRQNLGQTRRSTASYVLNEWKTPSIKESTHST